MLFNAWAVVIAESRRERGLTREQAAVNAGVATSTWYRWETGSGPGPHHLLALARGLGISPDDLAYRYAETLLRHYELRRRETAGGAAQPGGGPGASLPDLQGLSPHGMVVVSLSELVDKLIEIRTLAPDFTRPRRPLARPVPRVAPRRRRRRPQV